MGTRSTVGLVIDKNNSEDVRDWKLKSRYCHWDGYPGGVGESLTEMISAVNDPDFVMNRVTDETTGWSVLAGSNVAFPATWSESSYGSSRREEVVRVRKSEFEEFVLSYRSGEPTATTPAVAISALNEVCEDLKIAINNEDLFRYLTDAGSIMYDLRRLPTAFDDELDKTLLRSYRQFLYHINKHNAISEEFGEEAHALVEEYVEKYKDEGLYAILTTIDIGEIAIKIQALLDKHLGIYIQDNQARIIRYMRVFERVSEKPEMVSEVKSLLDSVTVKDENGREIYNSDSGFSDVWDNFRRTLSRHWKFEAVRDISYQAIRFVDSDYENDPEKTDEENLESSTVKVVTSSDDEWVLAIAINAYGPKSYAVRGENREWLCESIEEIEATDVEYAYLYDADDKELHVMKVGWNWTSGIRSYKSFVLGTIKLQEDDRIPEFGPQWATVHEFYNQWQNGFYGEDE